MNYNHGLYYKKRRKSFFISAVSLSLRLYPNLAQYPEDFQILCNELVSQYDKNLTAFLSSIEEFSAISKLSDADFPYIYSVLMNLSNTAIAERMNTSIRTVNRRLDAIFKILGVNNKKELKNYLKNNI